MKINLASTRLAFILIAGFLILIILSAIIPQEDFAQHQVADWRELLGGNYAIIETLGLDRIYYTPTFFILLGLLAINLLVGNIKRFKIIYRTEKTLLRMRHVGSIVFHLSLLFIIAGVVLNVLFKYNGVFALTEGQQVEDRPELYFREFRGPLHADDYGRFSLQLDRVNPEYQVDDALATAAQVRLLPAGESEPLTADIITNRPLVFRNTEIHFGLVAGYSPEVVVRDTSENILFRSFVRIAAQKSDGETLHSDFVLLLQGDMQIGIVVVPDGITADPAACDVTVQWKDDLIYEDRMARTDTARFAGWELTIPRLRRWCYIDVVESPYLGLVFFGFWSALAGLTIGFVPRLTDTQRQG